IGAAGWGAATSAAAPTAASRGPASHRIRRLARSIAIATSSGGGTLIAPEDLRRRPLPCKLSGPLESSLSQRGGQRGITQHAFELGGERLGVFGVARQRRVAG